MTPQIENLILQIENETGISANTKTRVGNVLRKISEQVDLAVPYTGATQNVDLNTKAIIFEDPNTAFKLTLKVDENQYPLNSNINLGLPSTDGVIVVMNSNQKIVIGGNGGGISQSELTLIDNVNGSNLKGTIKFVAGLNANDKEYYLPDFSGFFAISGDIGFTGTQTFLDGASAQKTMTFENGILISIT
jgi:hypothetical protein